MQKQQKMQIIKGVDNSNYFWKYKKYYTLARKADLFTFLKILETVSIAYDDIKFMEKIEAAKEVKNYSFVAKYTKEYMKLRSKKFIYTKEVRQIYFYRKKKKKRKRINHPFLKYKFDFFQWLRRRKFSIILKKYNKLIRKRKIGVCLYTTLNNFYILVIDYNIKSRPILAFVSGGMINSHKRFNRKRYHTVELCTRKISFYLKKKNIRIVSLFIYSFFRRKFLRVFLRGLKYHRVYLRRIYDFRRVAHNGCVLTKVRRI
jgi:hypothetical protein